MVTAGVLCLSWILQAGYQFGENSVDAAFSLIYLTNLRLLYSLDYFTVDALSRPFTHYGSLAVEEQFYILFPLLVPFFNKPKLILLAAMTASLCLCFLYIFNPLWAFYLPLGRFSRILFGVCLAIALKSGRSTQSLFILAFSPHAMLRQLLIIYGRNRSWETGGVFP